MGRLAHRLNWRPGLGMAHRGLDSHFTFRVRLARAMASNVGMRRSACCNAVQILPTWSAGCVKIGKLLMKYLLGSPISCERIRNWLVTRRSAPQFTPGPRWSRTQPVVDVWPVPHCEARPRCSSAREADFISTASRCAWRASPTATRQRAKPRFHLPCDEASIPNECSVSIYSSLTTRTKLASATSSYAARVWPPGVSSVFLNA